MKINILLILLVIFLVPCVSGNIIILNETEKEHYALEMISVTGDLNENKLRIEGSGEVISGSNVKVYLFGSSSDFLVNNLIVNNKKAVVSFDSEGYYFIAEKGELKFTGNLEIRTIGQIKLYVPGPLNEIEFDTKNGYTIDAKRYGLFKDTIIIQRNVKSVLNVEGEFHYKFEPYKNSFNYLINFKSFGGDIGRYELYLPNLESIQSITGALTWHQSGDIVKLELEGNTATVMITGTFSSNNLKVPIKEGKHYVLVESDPEKMLTISTSATEIDLTENPIRNIYSNARSFIADYNQQINVNVKKLGLLPSLAASVSNAEQTIAITPNGGVVGQTKYRYSNTGVDYLPIKIPGTPLYASTSRGPVKLTKDDDFLLAFPKQNNGQIEVIYYETIKPLKVISLIDVPLTDIDIPITKQTMSIVIPKEFFVLNIFGIKGGSELPNIKSVILFVILIGMLGFFLFKNYKYTTFFTLFLSTVFLFDIRLFFLLIFISIILILKNLLKGTKISWKIPLIIIASIIGIGVFFFLINIISSMFAGGTSSLESLNMKSVDYAYDNIEREVLTKVGDSEATMSAPMKEGVLPVRLELPDLGKRITVTDHLVTKEKPSKLKILVVAVWLKYLIFLIGLYFGYLCFQKIKKDTINHINSNKKK
jgi:hypothetical protein